MINPGQHSYLLKSLHSSLFTKEVVSSHFYVEPGVHQRSEQTVSKANSDMLNGTTKLIYSRARQMGYAVEEVKKGKDVQLVLVRLQ